MIDPEIPDALVGDALKPLGVVSVRAVPPGMSGAKVFKCQLDAGDQFALKRWPAGSRVTRIEEVHGVIQQSGETCGLVPKIQKFARSQSEESSIHTHAGEHWDLLQWMPGSVAAAEAPLPQIQAGAAAIAQFHASTRCLGTDRQPPLAVQSRLKRLGELSTRLPSAIAMQPKLPSELASVVGDACQLVRWSWQDVHARITTSLSKYAREHVQTQYVLRDVHREHVLFHQGRVSGLIDFDAVRVDTPMADLARWVGGFLAGRPDAEIVWEAAVAGFRSENTLISGSEMEIDPKMAKDLCFATTWISLANWLVWILAEQRSFPAGPKAVVSRLQELIETASSEI